MSSYNRAEVMEVAAALARHCDAATIEFVLDLVKEDDKSHTCGVVFRSCDQGMYHSMKSAKRALDSIPDDDIGDVVTSWIKQCDDYYDDPEPLDSQASEENWRTR